MLFEYLILSEVNRAAWRVLVLPCPLKSLIVCGLSGTGNDTANSKTPRETDEGVPDVDIVGKQEEAQLIEFHSFELAITAHSWQKMMQFLES